MAGSSHPAARTGRPQSPTRFPSLSRLTEGRASSQDEIGQFEHSKQINDRYDLLFC